MVTCTLPALKYRTNRWQHFTTVCTSTHTLNMHLRGLAFHKSGLCCAVCKPLAAHMNIQFLRSQICFASIGHFVNTKINCYLFFIKAFTFANQSIPNTCTNKQNLYINSKLINYSSDCCRSFLGFAEALQFLPYIHKITFFD